MRLHPSVKKWLRRGWRAAKTTVVLGAVVVIAVPLALDAKARAQTNSLLALMAKSTPATQSMPDLKPLPMPGMTGSTIPDLDARHMNMTPLTGKPSAGDTAAAEAILRATQAATAKYKNISSALAAGYRQATPFFNGQAHYTNYLYAALATANIFDPRRPTSLLYSRHSGHYTLIGVMFTASESDTPAELGALVPSTVAQWHQHHDLCLGGVLFGRAPNAASCVAGGGFWWAKSQWMLHVWTDQSTLAGAFSFEHPNAQPSTS